MVRILGDGASRPQRLVDLLDTQRQRLALSLVESGRSGIVDGLEAGTGGGVVQCTLGPGQVSLDQGELFVRRTDPGHGVELSAAERPQLGHARAAGAVEHLVDRTAQPILLDPVQLQPRRELSLSLRRQVMCGAQLVVGRPALHHLFTQTVAACRERGGVVVLFLRLSQGPGGVGRREPGRQGQQTGVLRLGLTQLVVEHDQHGLSVVDLLACGALGCGIGAACGRHRGTGVVVRAADRTVGAHHQRAGDLGRHAAEACFAQVQPRLLAPRRDLARVLAVTTGRLQGGGDARQVGRCP